jgi:hypothetical protein
MTLSPAATTEVSSNNTEIMEAAVFRKVGAREAAVGTSAADADAVAMHSASTLRRVRLRMPAILITFAIEMVVAFVISRYEDTLKIYPLLVAFVPVLSAISGNVGLQSSSIVVRNFQRLSFARLRPCSVYHDTWTSVCSEGGCCFRSGRRCISTAGGHVRTHNEPVSDGNVCQRHTGSKSLCSHVLACICGGSLRSYDYAEEPDIVQTRADVSFSPLFFQHAWKAIDFLQCFSHILYKAIHVLPLRSYLRQWRALVERAWYRS